MPLMRPAHALLLTTILMVSCTTMNPATGKQNFTLVGEQQEYALGQQTAEEEIKAIGLYEGKSALTDYIQNLGNRMWAQTERAASPVQVIVLDSDMFNAWAVPGYVNFYRGILPYFQNETQLAEVMGHEMGHINARHSAQGLTRGTLGSLALTAGGLILAASTDNDAFANMVTTVGSVGLGLGLTAYGRGDELEADRLALRYMARAGYDAREAYNSHQTFELYEAWQNQHYAAMNGGKLPPKGVLSNLTSTHPQTPDRAEQVKQLVGLPDGSVKLPEGVTPATTADDPFGTKRYLRMLDGLDYGPQKTYGIGGRNVVYFPSQRFVWRLPDSSAGGFITDLTKADAKDPRWKAVNPQGEVTAQIRFVPMQKGLNPAQTLMSAAGDLRLRNDWQQVTVGQGSRAQMVWTATGAAANIRNERGTPVQVRLVGVPIPTKSLLAVITYTYPAAQAEATEKALLTSLQAGDILTEEQAKALQPLKVRIKTAAGESVAMAAAKLPTGGLQEPWFRALNGLQPGTGLTRGQLYKTVVDEN